MDTAFYKKDTVGLRNENGLICRKAILKYRHGSFAQGFIVHRLAQIDTDLEPVAMKMKSEEWRMIDDYSKKLGEMFGGMEFYS